MVNKPSLNHINRSHQSIKSNQPTTHPNNTLSTPKTIYIHLLKGWTLEVHFSKPVFDLHSYNARIAGTAEGGIVWYLRPVAWNKVGIFFSFIDYFLGTNQHSTSTSTKRMPFPPLQNNTKHNPQNIPKGTRRLLVQGLTTPTRKDGIPLTATGMYVCRSMLIHTYIHTYVHGVDTDPYLSIPCRPSHRHTSIRKVNTPHPPPL